MLQVLFAVTLAQSIGGLGAIGAPGPVAAVRVSVPLVPRSGIDVDFGRVRRSNGQRRMIGAQVRWLREPRRSSGVSDYGIFGILHTKEEQRNEFRFPDRTIVQIERANGFTPAIGYGVDWLSPHGARIGTEFTIGGNTVAGPRILGKLFVAWGLPERR